MIIQQQIKNISNELNNHKKEVQILRSEKDTLESVLTMKTADVKKSLSNELVRIEEEMKRHFNFQKAENSRIQQQITALKGEKTALQQQLLGLQRRITELEMQVGGDAQWFQNIVTLYDCLFNMYNFLKWTKEHASYQEY